MNKTLAILLTTAAFAMGGAAFAADNTYEANTKIEQDNSGNYTKDVSASHKDSSGKVSSEVKTESNTESNGDMKQTTTTEHVNDPNGLMNENKVKTKDTVKKSGGKTTHHYKKTVNGNTVVNSNTTTDTGTGNTSY